MTITAFRRGISRLVTFEIVLTVHSFNSSSVFGYKFVVGVQIDVYIEVVELIQ